MRIATPVIVFRLMEGHSTAIRIPHIFARFYEDDSTIDCTYELMEEQLKYSKKICQNNKPVTFKSMGEFQKGFEMLPFYKVLHEDLEDAMVAARVFGLGGGVPEPCPVTDATGST